MHHNVNALIATELHTYRLVTVVSFKYILPQFFKNESTLTRGTKLKKI